MLHRSAATWRQPNAATLPSRTHLPFQSASGDVLVLVDDENIRLTAELEFCDREPDYAALADRCADALRSAELHVFTVRQVGPHPIPASPRSTLRLHAKTVPGKNVDIEAAIWLTDRLSSERNRPSHILIVTGDVDYLALHELGTHNGIHSGFLAAPGRSLASALRCAPLGILGRDVLRRPRIPCHAWSMSVYGRQARRIRCRGATGHPDRR